MKNKTPLYDWFVYVDKTQHEIIKVRAKDRRNAKKKGDHEVTFNPAFIGFGIVRIERIK